MTLLKRLLTSIGLFFPLFIVLYFGICMVGGGIQGGKVAAENPNAPNLNELCAAAGRDFVRNNLKTIVLTALGISLTGSLMISFSGVLPWCKKPPQPPEIPQGN